MDVSRLLQPIPSPDEEERHGHRGQEAGVQESAGDFDQGENAVGIMADRCQLRGSVSC